MNYDGRLRPEAYEDFRQYLGTAQVRYVRGARRQLPRVLRTMAIAPRPRILLIDDDPNVRDVLQHLLASLGYDCQTAADGVSGLARVDQGGWDLVLVDVVMPAMSGWTVVETIRQRAPTLPIVLITGMNAPAVMRRASEGRLPVITKPFRFEAVQTIVATALQARRA